MPTTDFGFKTVDEQDKARRVRGVFDSVASKYDTMNDLMSLGLHRVWKAYTAMVANVKPGHKVLDIAGGTGDMAMAFEAQGRGGNADQHQFMRGYKFDHSGRFVSGEQRDPHEKRL